MNKKINFLTCAISLIAGLAMTGGGIYLLASGKSTVNGGVIVGIGIVLCVLCGVSVYMIKHYEKLREEAARKMAEEEEKFREAVMKRIEEARRLSEKENGSDTVFGEASDGEEKKTDGGNTAERND